MNPPTAVSHLDWFLPTIPLFERFKERSGKREKRVSRIYNGVLQADRQNLSQATKKMMTMEADLGICNGWF